MPSLTRDIKNDSDLAKRILNEVRVRIRESESKLSQKHKQWREAEDAVLAYMPEREVDAARRATREGGLPQYTTIVIPYTYAVLMSAHTYLTSVFMARNPVHQFTGRHGESQQKVQAMEALVDYQTLVGKILPHYYVWIYDALKYGLGVIGLHWEDRYDTVTRITEAEDVDAFGFPTGKTSKTQSTEFMRTYSGNKAKNIQPWDFLWDTRYPALSFQDGEYCAIRFSINWNEAKRRELQGFMINLEELGRGPNADYAGTDVGSGQMFRPETTESSGTQTEFSEMNTKHPMMVKGYHCYIEIIPKEWGLGPLPYPEKWVFTVSGDFRVLLGAQPAGAYHSKFPFGVLPLDSEGYGLVTRGMPEILKPVQQTVDWLINSHFYNVRASVNNTLIVDPSRIVMKDMLDPKPGKIVRLKPAAYGTDVKMAWGQVQVNDVTQNNLRDFQVMLGIGERAVGINDQIMGMLQSGGRKTATEVRTSTSFGVNRLKTTAEWFSAVGFDPVATMLVQNTQQYYDMEQQFRVAGDLLQSAGPAFLQVNPEMISGFYDYVPVDGTMPIDRYAQVNLWLQMFSQIRTMPEIMFQYDMAGIFEWVAQLAGLKNITRFKIQLAPEQQLMLKAQAGNVVPMKRPGGGGAAPPSSGSTSPAGLQIPGMGAAG